MYAVAYRSNPGEDTPTLDIGGGTVTDVPAGYVRLVLANALQDADGFHVEASTSAPGSPASGNAALGPLQAVAFDASEGAADSFDVTMGGAEPVTLDWAR